MAVLALCFFASLMLVACSQEPDKPYRVHNVEVSSRKHIAGNLDYAQSPPAGGNHNPVWQTCGFYEEPIRDENAVQSLEHGAVWITYSPDLPQDKVEHLRDLTQNQTYILVSPYPDQDSPVVATAWGKQLPLESASDT